MKRRRSSAAIAVSVHEYCSLLALSTEAAKLILTPQNGELYIYPKRDAVTIHGEGVLTDYSFAKKQSSHCFCSICGVTCFVKVLSAADDRISNICPVNVRTIHGVDLEKLKVEKFDGWNKMEPKYEV